jgi:hypothetical protein
MALFPLERHVYADRLKRASAESWAIVTDASPWGGGAILQHNGRPTEYACWAWNDKSSSDLQMPIGDPAAQSFWEFLTIALALTLWGPGFIKEPLAVLSDSTSALQDALDLKGKKEMLAVAQELSWRQARGRWWYEVGHLPAEQNDDADALSRLAAPERKTLPASLRNATERQGPEAEDFWKLR